MSQEKKNEVKAEFLIDVPAHDKDKKLLGTGKQYNYSLNQAGLDAAIKRFTLKSLMTLLNAKFKTDKRNEIAAAAKAPEKGIKTKCKVMVDMIKTNKHLKAIFIKEVETNWEHIDLKTRQAVLEILKAA